MSEKANDLLNKFGSAQFDFMVWNTPDNLVARDKARQEISDYIAELEEKQRWIPVSERLPEVFKVVHVIDMNDTGGHLCNLYGTAMLVEVSGNKRFGFIGHCGWDTSDVTHWMYAMPLPQPPIVYGKEREE